MRIGRNLVSPVVISASVSRVISGREECHMAGLPAGSLHRSSSVSGAKEIRFSTGCKETQEILIFSSTQ
jgi:hypothetical protein